MEYSKQNVQKTISTNVISFCALHLTVDPQLFRKYSVVIYSFTRFNIVSEQIQPIIRDYINTCSPQFLLFYLEAASVVFPTITKI